MEHLNLSELTPHQSNANLGTERGAKSLEASLSKLGAGRSILIDKNGKIIAGNKTAETAGQLGLDDCIIVQTDGSELVAVQRIDLDLDTDARAKELAYADNRVGELDLNWDKQQMLVDLEGGLSLEGLFNTDELDRMLRDAQDQLILDASPSLESDDEPTEIPASHVRMVQLFFDEQSIQDFNRNVDVLQTRFGTTNASATVLQALKVLCEV